MMTISCYPRSESQLRQVIILLMEAGLGNQYEEEAHGEKLFLSVHARTFEERELVREILQDAGLWEVIYGEDTAA